MSEPFDVVIAGGGMAGLTLALQLGRAHPSARIAVVERTTRPLPEACHKVGESTVEIGARYLEHTLGLRGYLEERHLRKNGLRFFCGVPAAPVEERAELGPSERPRVPSFQVDRGRLENDLRAMIEAETSVVLREGWGVRDVVLREEGPHEVVLVAPGGEVSSVEARWVIDAMGRRRMIVKKLGLHTDPAHQASAAWFRVKGRLEIGELVDASHERWHARDVDKNRWLSTVHLTGTGYWVWLIPLASGHWSVGAVVEHAAHEWREIAKPEALRAWLAAHEPALARRLEGAAFEDFLAMKDYRYGASRLIGRNRWACVGESGVFVDPLYSPGADFIGIGNCQVAELIADDLRGAFDVERADELDRFLRAFADLTTHTTVLGSMVFGKPEALAGKLYWDFVQYWAFICQYFFQEIHRLPAAEHRRFTEMLLSWIELNRRAQRVVRAWAEMAPHEPATERVNLPQFPSALADFHLDLMLRKSPDETYRDMERDLARAEEVVSELVLRALRRAGPERAAALAAKIELPDIRLVIDEQRLAADEAEPRVRRKMLPKAIRDMERAIGKSAAEDPGAPTLRQLLSLTG